MCRYKGIRWHRRTIRRHLGSVYFRLPVDRLRSRGQRAARQNHPGLFHHVPRELIHSGRGRGEDNTAASANGAAASLRVLCASFDNNCRSNLGVSAAESKLLSRA